MNHGSIPSMNPHLAPRSGTILRRLPLNPFLNVWNELAEKCQLMECALHAAVVGVVQRW